MKQQSFRMGGIVALAFLVGACGGGDDTAAVADSSKPAAGGNSTQNRAPSIMGSPATAALIDASYSFRPSATDPDSGSLTFSIENAPRWASFNTTTGELSGTPSAQDVGTTSGIVISARNSHATASLRAFSLTVQARAPGSTTLSWSVPTANTDGSPLRNLSGYKVYWGTREGQYPNSLVLDDPSLTTYLVENLLPGTYYFVATALNGVGAESDFSRPLRRTVQ